MLLDIVKRNRSYRRFYQNHKIEYSNLHELIELARLSPSPRNQQALKFIISNDYKKNTAIFETLSWAGALPNWNAPIEGEKPSAYIIILGDNSIIENTKDSYHNVASGIVAQTIMLGASEKKLGGCMIAAIKRKKLRNSLNIDTKFDILLVLALGKPKEKVVITDLQNNNYNYFRDEKKTHFVPKRKIDDIIL